MQGIILMSLWLYLWRLYMNNVNDTLLTPESFRDQIVSFQRIRIILSAFELGIFTAIGEDKKSSQEVAKLLKLDPRATDRLMNALCALGLLLKEKNTFMNKSFAARYLVKGNPDYMGGLMHSVHLWKTWSTLTRAVTAGTSIDIPEVNERGEKWLEAFIAAMHERASKNAAKVVSMLDLSNVLRVLDVGGGSAAYAMAFARAKQGLQAVVFDLPNVIPITKSYIKQEALSDVVTTAKGDYLKDPLPRGFDLLFLSAIIHSNSSKDNQKLMKKCAKSLNPHGKIVVLDFIVNEDRTAPPWAVIFALNMLVGTESGDTYTESEVQSWMHHAGITSFSRLDTDFHTSLIIGSGV
jgi:ubiquinone/menaquinone biosynthesis C-methylase UbiE